MDTKITERKGNGNDQWLPLSGMRMIGKKIRQVYCDTRFFHVYRTQQALQLPIVFDETDSKETELFRRIQTKEHFDGKYLIDRKDIIKFLKSLSALQKKNKVIVLHFDVEGERQTGWTKYLRIYRLMDGSENFIVTNNFQPIAWRKLNDETLSPSGIGENEQRQ